ncbi:MAG: hypothetical protein AMJ69_13215 [Gammaproteobacteria bacterium SG8_47]|nr:MAG: hypothetical protein AMJ69_13215 [Gammaproteobacteria bacterium SG8_47]
MERRHKLCLACLWPLLILFCDIASALERPELEGFVMDMVQRHGFEENGLRGLLDEAALREDILKAIANPAEAKPWYEYRPIFLTPQRINDGIEFWRDNAQSLDAAQKTYGVAPAVIVAIIGVETRYGRHTGKYRVIDSLSTLAFAYPPRAAFFRSELEQYLLLTREEGIDPLGVTGSYAGAMGLPQFISSSYRAYAVDFDGDGRRDIWHNSTDAIGSVANYFARHGWQPDQPIANAAIAPDGQHQPALKSDRKAHFTAAQLRERGIKVSVPVAEDLKGSLLTFQTEHGPEHWVGWHNFFVITRYNHSALYAMAVFQLSELIKAGYEKK